MALSSTTRQSQGVNTTLTTTSDAYTYSTTYSAYSEIFNSSSTESFIMYDNITLSECPPAEADPWAAVKLFNFILLMFITLFGLTGNILSILTFRGQAKQTSATTFLMALAVFDCLLIITTDLFAHRYAYPIVFPSSWVDPVTAGKITIGILPLSYMCQSFSTWTVVFVALDRYIHVCHPLTSMRWCKVKKAKLCQLLLVITAVLYNLPRFFEYYKILEVAREAIDPCSGYFSTPKQTLGADPIYQYFYAFGLYMFTMYALPVGALIFFNGNLIMKFRMMKIPGSDGKTKKLKGSDKIVPSLIIVVTVFIICQIPDMVLQILWRTNSKLAPTFSIIAYDFIIINSSANFTIYTVAAPGFRKSLKKILRKVWLRHSDSDSTMATSKDMMTSMSQRSGAGTKYSVDYNDDDETDTADNNEERNWKQKHIDYVVDMQEFGKSNNKIGTINNSFRKDSDDGGVFTGPDTQL